ncbi:hypothetical protein BFP75_18825 [Maribacter sp. 4G9]|nr:hypothetical protein BFP75_18825 [Maribacter sp. 4G9]
MDGQLPFPAQQVRYDHRKLERIQLFGIHCDSVEKIQEKEKNKSLNHFIKNNVFSYEGNIFIEGYIPKSK